MNTHNESLPLRIELVQFNPKVGDLQANSDAIVQVLEENARIGSCGLSRVGPDRLPA